MAIDLTRMTKQLAGYWARPSREDFEETVMLGLNNQLEFKVTPKTAWASGMNVVMGESRHGTWGLTARRPRQVLDMVRDSSYGSSRKLPGSSAALLPRFLRDFARYDPDTGRFRDEPEPAGTAHRPQIGWLILKTTKRDSRLNLNLAGTHLHLADWFNDLAQVFGDNIHAILAYEEPELTLRMSDGRVETWTRIARFMPEAGEH